MTEKGKKFCKQISADENLRKQFEKVKSVEEVVTIAGKNGYDIKLDDIKIDDKELGEVKEKTELNKDELEKVAGGGGCGCAVVGYGIGKNKYGQFGCGCTVYGTGCYESNDLTLAKKGLCLCAFGGAGATNEDG